MSARDPAALPADLARFEPTPSGLGLTTDPEATRPQVRPVVYVTEIWCPPADDGQRSLHLPMREPEPALEHFGPCDRTVPEPETEAGL